MGGGAAGRGVGVEGNGGSGAECGMGGGVCGAITVAESSERNGVATVASGSSCRSTRNAMAPKRSSWLFLSACSAILRLLT